jgi:aspartyl-tRNA(Asn)/glutamyl-tRNA(Gln) amidotransferase subunit B
MEWEVVIGLETHVQLSTESKIFSGASCAFGADPNTHACYIDLALPGALPVLNRTAVEKAMRFGLAIGAEVAEKSVFDRKNYFYPDLPKGYQISQFPLPIVKGGKISFTVQPRKGEPYRKTVNLTRAHLEEDAGKSVHGIVRGKSGMDLNRAGTPLLEIVTEPDIRSAEEAVGYAKALHALVVWIGMTRGNMQEGNFRCDANVSVRPKGERGFGTRCEIKNLNSFKFLQEAIDYEMYRQIQLIESGEKVVQATRLYDPATGETRLMRVKEDSMDYRYFPDPDLMPLIISDEWKARVADGMPELPEAMRTRLVNDLGLTEYDADVLTASRDIADYYSALAAEAPDKKIAANWVMGEVASAVNGTEGMTYAAAPVRPEVLAQILKRLADGTINAKGAKRIFQLVWEGVGSDVDGLIESEGLKQISDASAIEPLIDEVLAKNQKMVDEFRAGKQKAFNALVGQCMKATRGKANPQQVNELLRKKLGA